MTPAGVEIRPLTAADRAAVAFTFARLGERSRYQRFLRVKEALTPPELDRLLAVDHWHHEALIAFSPPPRAPIGVARYVRADRFDHAEVALEVVDAWQRRGVGSALLAALAERACAAGIRFLVGIALTDNHGARGVGRRLGHVEPLGAEAGVAEFAVALAACGAAGPVHAARRSSRRSVAPLR